MKLTHLRVLIAVIEERNLTRAAERLNLSQPAVSVAIARLRDQFGDPLFLPRWRGVVPTSRAIELAARVETILRAIDDLTEVPRFDPATTRTTVTIGANDFGIFSVVSPLIRSMRQVAPGIDLVVRRLEEDISGQFDRLEIDLALTILSAPRQGAHVETLFREAFVCAMDKTHPCADKQMSVEDFCRFDHIRVAWADKRLQDPVNEMLSELNRTRRTAAVVHNFFSLPMLLDGTDFIAVAPERVVSHFSQTLTGVPLPLSLPGFTLNMVWDDRMHTNPCHMWLRDQIRQVAGQLEPCSGGDQLA